MGRCSNKTASCKYTKHVQLTFQASPILLHFKYTRNIADHQLEAKMVYKYPIKSYRVPIIWCLSHCFSNVVNYKNRPLHSKNVSVLAYSYNSPHLGNNVKDTRKLVPGGILLDMCWHSHFGLQMVVSNISCVFKMQ